MRVDPLMVMMVGMTIILCCLGGAILFYRAIRSFRAKKFWSGFGSLLCSLLLILIVLGMLPSPSHHRFEKGRRADCMHNLKQFTLFLKIYANDHDDKYPVTFDDLVGGYKSDPEPMMFVCPSSGHKTGGLSNIHAWTDYAYVAGLTRADPSNCVVMFCTPCNHKGDGANVAFRGGRVKGDGGIGAFIDGHVQWFNCKPDGKSPSEHQPTFQELTNSPALFYGTTNEDQLADLRKRTRIIYPHTTGR